MGNYASACIISPIIKTNKAARVIFPAGEIRHFPHSINAAEIMLDCPNYFLVNSRSLNINRRFSPLSADEDLEAGSVYILFPMRRLNSMVTPADMAVFWMTGKRISSGRISPEMITATGGDREKEVAEQPRPLVEVPEFSYRLAASRSRKPFLDTIREEPVCV